MSQAVRAIVLAATCVVLVPPATAQGQGTTGELAGYVVMADGRPAALARVSLSALGIETVADTLGWFHLAGLPVGSHAVRISTTSGASAAVEVRVSAERRTLITLRVGDLAGGATPPDLEDRSIPLTSSVTVTGEALRGLPVDDVREALRSEVGLVETDRTAGPVLRGARPGDATVFLDGVPFRIARQRAFGLGLPLPAVEEVTTVTGPLGPAFGDAESGVINLVTRSGTSRLGANVTAATDALFGNGTSIGLNRFDASGGGRLGNAFSIFAAASLLGEDAIPRGAGTSDVLAFVPGGLDTVITEASGPGTPSATIPQYVQVSGSCDAAANGGTSCRGRSMPYDWRTAFAGTVRADWRYGAGSGLALTAFTDRTSQRSWPGALSFDPPAAMGTRRSALAFVARWTHAVTSSITTDVSVSRQVADLVSGALDSTWEAAHRDPTMGIELGTMGFLVDFDHFSSDVGATAVTRLQSAADWDQLVRNVNTNDGTRVPLLDQNQYRTSQPYRMNPWAAATGLPTQGLDPGYAATTLSAQRYWIGRANVTLRSGTVHRVRLGADWQSSDVRWFNSRLLSQSDMDVYAESPRQMGAFGEYRFTTRSVAAEVGVRWERFDPNTAFPVVPGRIFTNPNFDPADPLNPADSVFAPASARSVLLPSLRLAWGILPGTALRGSVVRQARHPDEAAVYGGKNRDLSFSNTLSGFGGMADWPRTWLFEVGVRQALGRGLTLDMSGWLTDRDRDVVPLYRPFYDPTRGDTTYALVTSNADTAGPKGLDASLTATIGRWLEARVGYSYQDARKTYGVPDNRKHTFAGRVAIRAPEQGPGGGVLGTLVRRGEVAVLFRVASGLPYTTTINEGLGTISPDIETQPRELLWASTTPAIRELDLRVTKRFVTGGLRWGAFLDARNLLGFTNTLHVYSETGEITNDRHRELLVDQELARLWNEAGDRLVTITKDGRDLLAADLQGDCTTWSLGPANCVLLRRAEARWGDGDGIYDEDEQRAAFGALYDLFFGPWTLRGTPRHLRVGLEIRW